MMHWRKKHAENKKIHQLLNFYIPHLGVKYLPCEIYITRISPRKFDHDNYIYSCKPIRDFLADRLIPGKAPGQADSDARMQFYYYQTSEGPKKHLVQIEIVPARLSNDQFIKETLFQAKKEKNKNLDASP